jgi:asparagine synthase (glutamine-hydrolysing)
MSGINLILDKKNTLNQEPILAMNKAIAHRRPNASFHKKVSFHQSTIYLGVNKLNVSNSESDINPLGSSENQNHHLCFSGNIYNHQELRQNANLELARKYTETDLFLAGLESKGILTLSELNGIYAFIYVDAENETIFFGRDPQGVKPLYYFEDEQYLIISSEIKGILASGLVKKKLNEQVLRHYLQFRYALPPDTFFQNIVEVIPSQYLQWTDKGLVKKKFTYNSRNTFTAGHNLVKETKNLLLQSLQRQVQKDSNIGLSLSGGVDSTLLLALWQELGIKSNPFLYTIGNRLTPKYYGSEDFVFAQKAAKTYNAEINLIEISEQIFDSFPEYIKSVDQPVADNAAWLMWLLAKKSSKTCKTVLSGTGADELFAGYNRHHAFEKYLKIMPYTILGLNGLAFLPEKTKLPFSNTFRLLNKLTSSLDKSPEKTWENFIALTNFKDDFFRTQLIAKSSIRFNPKTNLLRQALDNDLKNYLPYDVLKISDNSSMPWSQEVRFPYLDLELSSYAQSIPVELLVEKGNKWILKVLLKQVKGKQFTTRKKVGFGMPLNQWLQSKQGDILLSYIRDDSNPIFQYVNYNAVNQLIDEHLKNKKDHTGGLYALIVLAAWIRENFV